MDKTIYAKRTKPIFNVSRLYFILFRIYDTIWFYEVIREKYNEYNYMNGQLSVKE